MWVLGSELCSSPSHPLLICLLFSMNMTYLICYSSFTNIRCPVRFESLLIFFYFNFSLHPECSLPSLLSSKFLPLSPTSPIQFSVSLQKRASLDGYQPFLPYEVAVRLGTSSSRARQGNPVEGKGLKARQPSQRQLLHLLLGPPQEDQAIQL